MKMSDDRGPRKFIYGLTDAKRQHTVAQVYLKRFADSDADIPWLDLDTGRAGVAGSQNLAVRKGYHDFDIEGMPVSFEGWLGQVEGDAAPWLAEIATNPESAEVTLEGQLYLARFMAAQYFRGPGFRSHMNALEDEMVAKIKDFAGKMLPPEVFEYWDAQPDDAWLQRKPDEDADVKDVAWFLEGTQGWANLFLGLMEWEVLSAPKHRRFYTSDAALVRRRSPRAPSYDPGSFGSWDYYLPVSPNVVLQLRPEPPGTAQEPLPIALVGRISRWELSLANSLQTLGANRFLYGRGPWLDRKTAERNLQTITAASATTRLVAIAPSERVSARHVLSIANERAAELLQRDRSGLPRTRAG